MLRWCVAAALLATGPRAAAQAPGENPAEVAGQLDTDGFHVELLGRPLPVGVPLSLPEGWFEVEEVGIEDHAVGSFAVVAVAGPAAPADAAPATGTSPPSPPPAAPPPPPTAPGASQP